MINEAVKTEFLYQLRSYGFLRIFLSLDFLIAILIFISLIIDKLYNLLGFAIADVNSMMAIFAAASTLFAITLAALAIILSFSNSSFMKFLREVKKVDALLFPFWLGNGAYLIVIILSTFYFIFNSPEPAPYLEYIFITSISFFVYAIINTFYLLATVIRFGYFVNLYEKQDEDTE